MGWTHFDYYARKSFLFYENIYVVEMNEWMRVNKTTLLENWVIVQVVLITPLLIITVMIIINKVRSC